MRNLNEIALEITGDWKKVNYGAEPYLAAMLELESINDNYHQDTARGVVLYFLANAGGWRGEVAKRIKLELKSLTK